MLFSKQDCVIIMRKDQKVSCIHAVPNERDNSISCGMKTVYILVLPSPKQQCSMRLRMCLVTV